MRHEKKQKKDKTALALTLSFCLLALVSAFAVKANIDKVQDNMEAAKTAEVLKETPVTEDEAGTKESAPADAEGSAAPEIVDSRDGADEEGGTSEAPEQNSGSTKPAAYIVPVQGDIIMEHSVDMPIYWETLDQYMTHSGIDISAPAGTPVQACADGTVTKIHEHDTMGVTAEINHGNGIISVYSNLAADGLIELGEIVTQGTIIGKVGQSSLFEFESPDHLHFEMRYGDDPADPMKYLTW